MAKLNATETTSETDVKGGYDPIAPGMYHVIITDAAPSERVSGDDIHFHILAGTDESQVGKVLKDTIFADRDNSDDFGDGHVRLALATGLIQPGQAADLTRDQYCEAIRNRQCVVKVGKRQDKNNKDKYYDCIDNRGFAIWGPMNPEVANVPKRQDYLQQGGYLAQAAAAPTAQVAAAPAAQAAPTAAPAAAPAAVGTPQYSV